MRFSTAAFLFVSLACVPAFSQNTQSAIASSPATVSATMPTDASNASVDYVALKDNVAKQNKNLNDQLLMQRAILKKNQDLLKEPQRINAANLRMAEEQKKLAAESAELEKQRDALKGTQKTEIAEK